MHMPPRANDHWPAVGTGLWTRWWGYLIRWLVFGFVISIFQPVVDEDARYWQEKTSQALLGLSFGLACAVAFTVAENKLNTPRVKWKTWLIVVATWLTIKVAFVTAIALI